MLTALVLICALGVAPADCDLDRSLGRIAVGGEFRSVYACLQAAMIEAAAQEHRFGPGTYPKIACTRWRAGNEG
jgi:hypothetical protein